MHQNTHLLDLGKAGERVESPMHQRCGINRFNPTLLNQGIRFFTVFGSRGDQFVVDYFNC